MPIRPVRVSTNDQDLTAPKNALAALGVSLQKTFTAQGLTGARPGLREALAAGRTGDTLVVTKLDRLARSLRDAKDIIDDLILREVKLRIGGFVHDPTDPVGRLLFNVLAMVTECEADLIRARTREGKQVAKAARRLRGKQPKLSPAQEKHLVEVHQRGEHTTAQISSGPPGPRSTGQSNDPGTPRPKRALSRGIGANGRFVQRRSTEKPMFTLTCTTPKTQ